MDIQNPETNIATPDNAERTYRGILFDSAEDLAFAKEEEKRLEIIMRTAAPDDAVSIETAIRQVSESTSPIKAIYLTALNNYKDALSQQQRTYRDVVYDTVEDAEYAKKVYVSVRSIMNQVNMNSEQSVASAQEQISAMNHPIAEETLNTLQNRLNQFDIAKRTVDGILLETLQEADLARQEYARIQAQLRTLNENDEAGMLAIKDSIAACTTVIKNKYLEFITTKLTEYDIRVRTFRGVIYDTRDLAAKHKEEAAMAERIMQTANAQNEQSMLTAMDELDKLTTDEKNAPIATLTAWLKAYDINARTVAGVLYNTREEAQLVTAELQRANEIMQKVSPDDEQSILNAQKEILELTTFVKDSKYEELNQIWQAYDQKARTYLKVVFATRKQAQSAKEAHAAFIKQFNTLDLSMRTSLTQLSNFVEDYMPSELAPQANAVLAEVRKVLDTRDYILQQETKIDINTQKKESAELYGQIEAILPKMTQYRMNTTYMEQLKTKHYASLNVAKKLFSFIKSKM